MMDGVEVGRVNVAARGCGVALRAFGLGIAYAQRRHAFGKPIAEHQAIQFKLAEMATKGRGRPPDDGDRRQYSIPNNCPADAVLHDKSHIDTTPLKVVKPPSQLLTGHAVAVAVEVAVVAGIAAMQRSLPGGAVRVVDVRRRRGGVRGRRR